MIEVESFEQLESRSVKVRVNLAAGFQAVKRRLRQEAAFQAVQNALEDIDDALDVVSRALSLAQRRTDPRYESPYDVALLGYLMLLQENFPELAEIVAENLVQESRLTWAQAQAHRMLRHDPTENPHAGTGDQASDQQRMLTSSSKREVGSGWTPAMLTTASVNAILQGTYQDDGGGFQLPDFSQERAVGDLSLRADDSGTSPDRIAA